MNEKSRYMQLQQTPDKLAVYQVADLCTRIFAVSIDVAADGLSFYTAKKAADQGGVLRCSATVTPDPILILRLELLRTAATTMVNSSRFFHHLAKLGDKVRLVPPEHAARGETFLCVEMRIAATPLSFSRQTTLTKELQLLDDLARVLQADLPRLLNKDEIEKQYSVFLEVLEPVYPFASNIFSQEVLAWAADCIEFLTASSSIAISCPNTVDENFALSLLATVAWEQGIPLARTVTPSVAPKGLVDLIKRVPGIIAVPAVRLTLGANPYELANETQGMMSALNASCTAVVFTGADEQLRTVFHGGQGGVADPLSPVVRHAPSVPVEALARLGLQSQQKGGLSPTLEAELVQHITDALQDYPYSEQKRLLPSMVSRTLAMLKRGKPDREGLALFATKVSSASETLAGMAVKPRAARSMSVADRFTQKLTDSTLASFLKQQLVGQDAALDQLVSRLRMEALTRPAHQPLRYCAQGTPATGKSESATLLASRLGIPYMNIDAASIPDYYSAAAQLLGSGRGIVGSYQSGRLEQAAKQHTGVLIEVSDLDHANDRVRSGLADLFLQVLETGEAQSAAGAMFSCANLIFAFTMNLPDGMDEAVRKRLGFNDQVSDLAVQNRVIAEMKRMLSTAFLSRVGTPILFQPLGFEAMSEILERAIRAAIESACARLQIARPKITMEADMGAKIAVSLQSKIGVFGARALLEQGRALAASAVANLQGGKDEFHLQFEEGNLCIT